MIKGNGFFIPTEIGDFHPTLSGDYRPTLTIQIACDGWLLLQQVQILRSFQALEIQSDSD